MLKRKQELLEIMHNLKLDIICLVPGANQCYLTGANFHLSERPTIISLTSDGDVMGIIPFLEKDAFDSLKLNAQSFYWQDNDGFDNAFKKAFQGKKIQRVGVEGQRMRFFESQAILRALPNVSSEILDINSEICSLRLQKKNEELVKIRKALAISEKALSNILPYIRIGMRETDIQALLLNALFTEGAEGLAFDPIIAAGENSANPHAHARSDYQIKHGDALLLDFGAIYQKYNADITRTFFVGNVSERDAALYSTVLEANQIGIQASKARVSAHEVDDKVQCYLESTEFSQFILHKTGHGLGMEVHEKPQIMRGNLDILHPGMTYTVEPGLYIKDDIGIRIEDVVLITEDGYELLSTFNKEITVL